MIRTDNFENIALSKDEMDYLKFINSTRYSETDVNPKAFSALESLGFAEKVTVNFDDGNGHRERKYQAVITKTGRRYLLYYEVKSKEKTKASRRYWITTGVAIVALIKSFLPEICAIVAWLLKQLGQ